MITLKFTDKINVYSDAPLSNFAAELFCNEINNRIKNFAFITNDKSKANFIFIADKNILSESYKIDINNSLLIYASDKRGFIYAVGKILRKAEKIDKGFALCEDVFGIYSPEKSIRGHQLGYRSKSNTYDAWNFEQYKRYCLELMYFGMNTVEFIPYENGVSNRNSLMKYDEEEFLTQLCKMADYFDLDVSLWQPNIDGQSEEEMSARLNLLYSKLSRINYIFVPGGDPGNLPAKEFIDRCKIISRIVKKYHPNAQVWPSAQAPHEIANWGEEFIDCLKKHPKEISGIIYGPNHAYPLNELREKTPAEYPIRFYPDITHNVRCEYPVHFDKNDWHFAFATTLGRESTNPRPKEFAHLYNLTKDYVIGSVSYSEGINDDVNKALWSALDFDNSISAKEAVDDYCRLYFFGTDTDKISMMIFSLENNWYGDPSDNSKIDDTYSSFENINNENKFLSENWRFLQLLLLSACDKLIKDRRIFELDLIEKSKQLVLKNKVNEAYKMLNCDFTDNYKVLRDEIDFLCEKLFDIIGLQTDVKNYYADNYERGAILETIDLPVTDRKYLLSNRNNGILGLYNNKINKNEFYYSVAYNSVKEFQTGEPYYNFKGDNPNINNGSIPTSLFNVYDNYSFVINIDNLDSSCDYVLRVTYLNKKDDNVTELKIIANDNIIYCGKQFGEIDIEYFEKYCSKDFITAKYTLPARCIYNGKVRLEFRESITGVMFAEFSLLKNNTLYKHFTM